MVSLLLHAALIAWGAWLPTLWSSLRPRIARAPEALRVRLVGPPPVAAPQPAHQPELLLREDTAPGPEAKPKKKPPREILPPKDPDKIPARRLTRMPDSPGVQVTDSGARMLAGDAARTAGEQVARQLFYPPDAIARGLEGEALVLLFLDEGGNAVAARIESSSGHALLDEAAVRAARTIRSLPASAPREAVLPVRFRLR